MEFTVVSRKRSVIGVTALITALVSIHGSLTFLSDVHCFFDSHGRPVWFSNNHCSLHPCHSREPHNPLDEGCVDWSRIRPAYHASTLALLPLSSHSTGSPNPRLPVTTLFATVVVMKLPSRYFGLTGINRTSKPVFRPYGLRGLNPIHPVCLLTTLSPRFRRTWTQWTYWGWKLFPSRVGGWIDISDGHVYCVSADTDPAVDVWRNAGWRHGYAAGTFSDQSAALDSDGALGEAATVVWEPADRGHLQVLSLSAVYTVSTV